MSLIRSCASVIALIYVLTMTVGCVVGVKHDYESQSPKLAVDVKRPLAVAAWDQRAKVVKGEEKEDYVGNQRGGYGNPWGVKTVDNKPLAKVFTEVIARSLSHSDGAHVTPVVVPMKATRAEVIAALKGTAAERLILITIREWDSDSYVNTDLDYSFLLEVMDSSGAVLATNELVGKDTIDGSSWDPAGAAKKNIPPAFRERMERLFANPKIATALR